MVSNYTADTRFCTLLLTVSVTRLCLWKTELLARCLPKAKARISQYAVIAGKGVGDLAVSKTTKTLLINSINAINSR